MKKMLSYLLELFISSLQTLLALIPCVFLLQAIENSVGEGGLIWLQVFLTLLLSGIYACFLIRRLYVKKNSESRVITEAYPNREAFHLLSDLKKVFMSESRVLLSFVGINLLFFIINLLESYLLRQAVLSFLLIPFYPIFYLQMILPAAWGWVSLPVMPGIYLLILSLHRQKWHREWVVSSPK